MILPSTNYCLITSQMRSVIMLITLKTNMNERTDQYLVFIIGHKQLARTCRIRPNYVYATCYVADLGNNVYGKSLRCVPQF